MKLDPGLQRIVDFQKFDDDTRECKNCGAEFSLQLSKQRVHCSAECRINHQNINQIHRPTNDYSKKRNCIVCHKQLVGKQNIYCSDECKKFEVSQRNKNPMSTYGVSTEWFDINTRIHGSVPTLHVEEHILELAENHPETSSRHIVEDVEEVMKATYQELNTPEIRRYHSKKYYKKKRRSARDLN
jgi:hypothetical protein